MSSVTNRWKSLLGMVLVVVFAASLLPAALAAEQPPQTQADNLPPAAEGRPVQSTAPNSGQAAPPVSEEFPLTEPAGTPEAFLPPAETFPVTPTPELDPMIPPLSSPSEPAEAFPSDQAEAASAQWYDPEDPLYYRMSQQVAVVSMTGKSFESYRPRTTASYETLRRGIDVSAFQGGNIDWNRVAVSGIDFVYVRVGYRTLHSGDLRNDLYFSRNLSGAKAAGLKVGAYIFSQALTVEEAREEADYLTRLISGYQVDLPLALDFEYADGRLVGGILTRQEATDICNAFCKEVEKAGYKSIVYSNPSILGSDLYREQLGRLWLAHWAEETTYSGSYEFWQCGTGNVNGISGVVDLDFWFDPGDKVLPPMGQEQAEPDAVPTEGPSAAPEETASPSATPEETTSPSSVPEETASPTQVPENTPIPALPFEDVPEGQWYYSYVADAYREGIVKGQNETLFAPEAKATRAQVVTMLYRMQGEPSVSSSSTFLDLTQDYYRDAVNWAYAGGVVAGTSQTTFSPDNDITREQLATMLYRLAGSPTAGGDLSQFTDSGSIDDWARPAMSWAVSAGVMKGTTEGTLTPRSPATRAEVCAMLMRYGE